MKRSDMYRRDRESGMTLQEIAKKPGVSHQAVAMACSKFNVSYFRPVSEKQCIYPGLRAWMNENKVGQAELIRRMGKGIGGRTSERIRCILRGNHDPKKNEIDLMLKVTGLTYEEMFKEDV